jgi:drug/metabolite transporter (DMT)-like permease
MLAAFSFALRSMPLSGVYVLFFIAPFIITAISVPLLGERVERRRWIVMAIGMTGVLIALRPTGEGVFTLAGLAVLFSATCYAVAAVGSRLASRTDSTESLMFWMTTLLAIGATALAAPHWTPLRAQDTWVIVGVAFAGAIGQYALTEAFRWGEASAVAPFEYTALAWGTALDLTIWHTLPDRWVFIGGAIIVASGSYLARRETAPERGPVELEHP